MRFTGIDHFVLTVTDLEATHQFYERLGAKSVTFGDDRSGDRTAVEFGSQKINLHEAGTEFDPHAADPVPGSGDFCLLTETPIPEVETRLADHDIEIVRGPVERTGARGEMDSVYVRDPDGNLVEIARYR